MDAQALIHRPSTRRASSPRVASSSDRNRKSGARPASQMEKHWTWSWMPHPLALIPSMMNAAWGMTSSQAWQDSPLPGPPQTLGMLSCGKATVGELLANELTKRIHRRFLGEGQIKQPDSPRTRRHDVNTKRRALLYIWDDECSALGAGPTAIHVDARRRDSERMVIGANDLWVIG